jgi:hypothetical protein
MAIVQLLVHQRLAIDGERSGKKELTPLICVHSQGPEREMARKRKNLASQPQPDGYVSLLGSFRGPLALTLSPIHLPTKSAKKSTLTAASGWGRADEKIQNAQLQNA